MSDILKKVFIVTCGQWRSPPRLMKSFGSKSEAIAFAKEEKERIREINGWDRDIRKWDWVDIVDHQLLTDEFHFVSF